MKETLRPFDKAHCEHSSVAPVTFVTSLSMSLYYEERQIAFANKETVLSRLTSFGITSDSRAILVLNFVRVLFARKELIQAIWYNTI